MDFFERQDQAHRYTKLLVVYFVLAVACITSYAVSGERGIYASQRLAVRKLTLMLSGGDRRQ